MFAELGEDHRLHPEGVPFAQFGSACEGESGLCLVRGQCPGQIVHDRVVMPVADEEDGKSFEKVQQKVSCPSFGQVSTSEVCIGEDHVSGFVYGPMDMDDTVEVPT